MIEQQLWETLSNIYNPINIYNIYLLKLIICPSFMKAITELLLSIGGCIQFWSLSNSTSWMLKGTFLQYHCLSISDGNVTFSTFWANSADHKWVIFYFWFFPRNWDLTFQANFLLAQKMGFDISCKLPPNPENGVWHFMQSVSYSIKWNWHFIKMNS